MIPTDLWTHPICFERVVLTNTWPAWPRRDRGYWRSRNEVRIIPISTAEKEGVTVAQLSRVKPFLCPWMTEKGRRSPEERARSCRIYISKDPLAENNSLIEHLVNIAILNIYTVAKVAHIGQDLDYWRWRELMKKLMHALPRLWGITIKKYLIISQDTLNLDCSSTFWVLESLKTEWFSSSIQQELWWVLKSNGGQTKAWSFPLRKRPPSQRGRHSFANTHNS